MGDNIRLKGPLGLKQDIYDQARSEEWRKIIKLDDPKEIIKKLEERIDKPKKEKNGGSIQVKKAAFGSLIKKMLGDRSLQQQDTAAPFRQTFNVKDSETGEVKNIMQDFKATSSQNTSVNRGIIGRLFGLGGSKQAPNLKPLQHDFYVKDQSGQNVNISEKKKGGFIDMTKDKKYWKGVL